MTETKPQQIIDRCDTLKKNWSTRATKFKDWYDILLLEDELEQEGMESVISNDPRTGYNLAKHLLVSMIIADKIPSDELPPENVPAVSYLEKYMARRWYDQEKRYRAIGRQGWLDSFVGWLLATGWYSVFAMVTQDELWSEVWSPADCFPDFGPDGLVAHAHIYKLSATAANKKVKAMGWTIKRPITSDITVYDYWTFDLDGDVTNAIVLENEFVKVPVKDIGCTKVGRLPIFTSPVGGLPDMGSIKTGGEWQQHFGESIVGTNENLSLEYNKMRSFLQQAARTAAQPHWLELSSGDTPIATEAGMNRYGTVFHGQPGESVTPLGTTPIPVEITSILFRYENELQRGLFPWAVFGNIQQQMSYLAMANVASAALQVLTPYSDAIKGMRTDVNNFQQDMIIMNGFRPHKFKVPDNLPDREDRRFDVDASVEIPGYLVQRATVARMLNPNFKLPESWTMERLFPEIKDTLRAQALNRSEAAMMHPKAILVDQILAYREQARVLREVNDVRAAELYEKLAKSLEAELEPRPPEQPPAGTPGGDGFRPPREVLPEELTRPLEGLGRTT